MPTFSKIKRAKFCQCTNTNNMKMIFYTAILILLNASNCSTPKDIKEIKFGEGGGFTGAVTEYQIKANGDIFVNKSLEKEQKKIKTIDKTEMKSIQNKLDKLSNESLKFNHPFNIYYFIEIDKGRIVWGDPAFPEPSEIKELYDHLQKIVNN